MKINTKKEKLLSYSAMAAAFIACGTDAYADIVYVDIPDATLGFGDFATLDLDGDGVVDFGFILDSSSASWTFIQAFGNLSALSYGNPDNMMAGYSGAFLPYASAIGAGDEIGPALGFLSSTYNLAFIASLYSGVTYGQFGDGTDKYIGVKFDIGGTLHYGWIRVNCSVGPVSMTIKDWAYDDNADTPIIAGDEATPLPVATFETDAIIVSEASGSTTFSVQINIPGEASVDLDVNDALSTATNGLDYSFTDPTTAVFTGGITTLSFDVTLIDDLDFEGSETIVIDIINPVGCELGAIGQYSIIINDDEIPLPPLVNFDGTAAALDESAGGGSIVINVSETTDCVVDYALNGALTTATEALDFTYSTGSIIFTSGGPVAQSFDYSIIDDAEVEATENIVFEITGVAGTCAIGLITQSAVAILDNDVAPVIADVAFESTSATIEEADAVFIGTVVVSESSDCIVTLGVNNAASTATEGTDFTFSTTSVSFTAGGATLQDFDLNIIGDNDIETDENVVIEITGVDGDCVLDGAASALEVVILNDDFVGIDEFAANGIQLYTYDDAVYIYFTVDQLANDTKFQLLDASGRMVFDAALANKQNKFTLTQLPAGVYMARILQNGKTLDKQVYLNN